MFWNEIEVLYMRLDILYDSVDQFIICESKISHSGKVIKSEYNFCKNINLFKKYLDKIIFLPVEKLPSKGDKSIVNGKYTLNWENENYQRKILFNEISKFPKNTIVAISDVDEIWSPSELQKIKSGLNSFEVCGIKHKLYYYYMNLQKNEFWPGTYFIKQKNLTQEKIQIIRNQMYLMEFYIESGWHFSWLGGLDRVKEKTKILAEHDLISEYSSEKNIKESITNRKVFFKSKEKLTLIHPKSQSLPKHTHDYYKKFPSIIYRPLLMDKIKMLKSLLVKKIKNLVKRIVFF